MAQALDPSSSDKLNGWLLHLVTTSPLFLLAFAYLCPTYLELRFVPGFDQEILAAIMRIEWLALASGVFVIGLLVFHAKTKAGQVIKFTSVLILISTFATAAWQMDGLVGFVAFFVLLYVSFGGAALFSRDQTTYYQRVAPALFRWLLVFVIFIGLGLFFDLPRSIESWRNMEVIRYGAWFFSVLALLEVTLFWVLVLFAQSYSIHRAEDDLRALEREEARRKLYGIGKD